MTGYQRHRWVFILLNLLVLCLAAALTPIERTLGANIRLIFLHGVWVWTGLIAFGLAGVSGLAGLLLHRKVWHTTSRALGLTGLAFWLTYLPMSLVVMQVNWGGLYFDEPRWRIPFAFAVVAVLLQTGLAVMRSPALTSAGNLVFGAALIWMLEFSTANVLHPDSPVAQSNSAIIQFYFSFLLVLALLMGAQIGFWLYQKFAKV
jgi:hypothetical protein